MITNSVLNCRRRPGSYELRVELGCRSLDNMHEITAAKLFDPEDGRLMETGQL